MARRELRPKSQNPYRYITTPVERSVDRCETAEETDGLHRIEPTVWPPRKIRGATDHTVFYPCTYCGTVIPVDPDAEDLRALGIDLVTPANKQAQRKLITSA